MNRKWHPPNPALRMAGLWLGLAASSTDSESLTAPHSLHHLLSLDECSLSRGLIRPSKVSTQPPHFFALFFRNPGKAQSVCCSNSSVFSGRGKFPKHHEGVDLGNLGDKVWKSLLKGCFCYVAQFLSEQSPNLPLSHRGQQRKAPSLPLVIELASSGARQGRKSRHNIQLRAAVREAGRGRGHTVHNFGVTTERKSRRSGAKIGLPSPPLLFPLILTYMHSCQCTVRHGCVHVTSC